MTAGRPPRPTDRRAGNTDLVTDPGKSPAPRSRRGCPIREYFPAFLDAFANHKDFLDSADARAILAAAPAPAGAARLTKARIAAALRRGGRKRGVDNLAIKLHAALRLPHLRQPQRVEQAMGTAALALLAALDTACANVDQLGEACAEAFAQHPDYDIITSFPRLGDLTGARVLAELGDDRNRFADARAVKAYAGSVPVTRASGRSVSITHRRIKNDRLDATGFVWAFIATTHAEPAKAHYQRRRDQGDRHAAALRGREGACGPRH
ncbi:MULTISPECIES: transposase [Catenuloplanes]|uniref:Transposase n=1 Tax=Catenuloplanes niger TaxID=587534 RepID=A0AAE3ZYD8_9ACTN|nr:transposase [Catenuloplanes niger]MDR7327504.1 transposase [Catenuloplanes niger]